MQQKASTPPGRSALPDSARSVLSNAVGGVGQVEVLRRQAPLRMGGKGEGDFVPPDIDIGVVVRLFCEESYLCCEPHRRYEIGVGECLGDLFSLAYPSGVGFEECLNLCVSNKCHVLDRSPLDRGPSRSVPTRVEEHWSPTQPGYAAQHMAIRHDQGIVLRSYPFGEADRVVVMLSPNKGKIRTVAKGVRKTKSRFGGRLEPFTHVDLVLYEGRNLDTITQVSVIEPFPKLRTDLDAVIAAGTMVEAADAVAQEEESSMRLFLLLHKGLRSLEAGQRSPDLITSFLLKLADVVGVAPALVDCASCGRVDDLHRFSFAGGGVICDRCRGEGAVRLRSGITEYLAALSTADFMELPGTSDVLAGEAMGIARRFVEYHLDRKLVSLAVME